MNKVNRLLLDSNGWFIFTAISAAFITYTSMYGIRQPYKAGTYTDLFLFGISYKVILVTSQVFGYMLSKFAGIRIIAEMKQKGRLKGIILCNSIALFSLFLFAVTPYPYNFIWMFVNGLPLGLIFGLVFSYLEGRRTTELLSIGLGCSIIISSGFVKTIGKWILQSLSVSEWWMPFITGCIFFPPLLMGAVLLNILPRPNANDIEHRVERVPMLRIDRKRFFGQFAPGIVLIVITYILLTILRDFRDTFNVEIWQELGYTNASIMTSTEIPVTIGVLITIGLITFIQNNRKAFTLIHGLVIGGLFISMISTFLFNLKILDAVSWMILTGLGLFMGYIVFNTIFFERMIATLQVKSNIGFLMYLADSFGYLASVFIMLYKDFGEKNMQFSMFFSQSMLLFSSLVIILMIGSVIYFNRILSK
jgi:MFS family permease